MPIKLSTLLNKVQELDSKENSETINKFYLFMKNNNSSERHIVNNLKVILNFENFFHPFKNLKEINRQDIDLFLDSKIKSLEIDPEKRWITTWNHYLNHLKFFYRWSYNGYNERDLSDKGFSDWVTPDFVKIKMKRTKRLSPYSHTEIWERDELLTIIKYEPSKRNKDLPIIALPHIKVPDVWSVVRLQEISKKINSGFPSGKHNKKRVGNPHIRPMNINVKGELDLTEIKYVENEGFDSLSKGDILFNNTNSPSLVGKTTLIKNDTNYAYSNHMTRIRCNTELVNTQWIAYALHNLFFQGFFKMNCTNHVNQASINSTFLAQRVWIPLPPLEEQNILVDLIEKGLSIVSNLEKEIGIGMKYMGGLRESILKQAFEGKLAPQDPNDEPASILLEKIKREKINNSKGKPKLNSHQTRLV